MLYKYISYHIIYTHVCILCLINTTGTSTTVDRDRSSDSIKMTFCILAYLLFTSMLFCSMLLLLPIG